MRLLSWKYVRRALLGNAVLRIPRACRRVSYSDRLASRKTRRRNVAYRASTNLVNLAIIRLIVSRIPVAQHCHNIWEYCPRSIVLVCVEEDAETLELIGRAENWAWDGTLFRQPHRKPIAEESALSSDFECEFDLTISVSRRRIAPAFATLPPSLWQLAGPEKRAIRSERRGPVLA